MPLPLNMLLAMAMAVRERNEIAVRQLLARCAEELETRTAKAVVRRLERLLSEAEQEWFLKRIVMKVGAPA